LRVIPLLLALGPGATAPLAAQGAPADGVLRGFQPIGDYLLEVDGKESTKAEVFQSESAVAILILAPEFPSPVLLSPRTRQVVTLDLMRVARQGDGSVDVLADAVLAPAGQFEVAGETVVFAAADRRGVLKPKPPLLKSRKGGELKAYDPGYARAARAYRPNDAALASLRSQAQPVQVRVFFGSWCSFCKRYLPRLLKVEDELAGSKLQFEYIGLPRNLDDPEAKRLQVNGVPTGIVFVGGREIGRLQGGAWQAPEAGLRDLLAKSGASGTSR
jgi:thiol-disulfide isomerase/thioredoxin